MEEEIWRDVPGFEGLYQIDISTKEGRCRSLNWENTGQIKLLTNKPRTLKGNIKRIFWGLSKNGKRTFYQAARWIAITYPELVQNEYFEGAEIDHISTDAMDNRPCNLRWVDKKGQQNNPLTKKHISDGKKGKTNPKKFKPVLKYDSSKKLIAEYSSVVEAARQTGVSKSVISNYCNHKRIDRQGYYWEFKEREAV